MGARASNLQREDDEDPIESFASSTGRQAGTHAAPSISAGRRPRFTSRKKNHLLLTAHGSPLTTKQIKPVITRSAMVVLCPGRIILILVTRPA
jgi:hypothetical protein